MNYSIMHCYIILTFVVIKCCESVYSLDIHNHKSIEKRNAINTRPNIVVLVADDMGWGDLGANHEQHSSMLMDFSPKTVTPYLDKLAKKGLRFTDFHTGASVCAPSRAALLTSRLGLRTGVVQNFNVDSAGGLPENETTIAKVMLDAGYRTAMFGKWHLGLTAGHHPMDHGFQSYLGVPYSLDMGCTNPPGINLPQCPGCAMGYGFLYDGHILECVQNIALPLISNRTIIHQPVKLEKLSSMMGTFAEDFILNRDDNNPFFLYGAFSQAHVPLLTENGTNLRHKVFNETLSEMDGIVGQILGAIEKLNYKLEKSGIPTQETLIWFLTDNGPWEAKCELSGSWGPFAGKWQRERRGSASKFTVWEGGHRVPSFVYWPHHIKAGRVSDALVSSMDLMPTLAAITGATLPPDRLFDGRDISELFLENTEKFVERVIFHPNSGAAGRGGEIGAVRIGSHKAVFYSGGATDCGGYTPPAVNHSSNPLVFNLSDDPAESMPLSPQSEIYKLVMSEVTDALNVFYLSLKLDNTTITDYSVNDTAKPCCSHDSPVCRCPWDLI